ncbi:MAG: ABC transporter ATP-binding protein [Candidatus Aminicenantes bacterium]|nr:MAG: ABC transporter ATP-binding protein [Candidatus Aminicenantes bacterium]
MKNTVIDVRDLSKKFRIYHEKDLNLKYAFINFLTGKKSSYYDEFWALRNINMDIKKGETIGLIGENGSGKSTLLKLMSRILFPDEGYVYTEGKIAALIEIGAGFHSELSGRENIYINGSILGFKKKEIEASLEEIIEFSGLERFIDNPIKTYSSGMYVRLGFSIAINVDPDILLIDEILAVGDENFQKKCLQKIDGFKSEGKTIIIVSHDLTTVEKMCDRVFLLDNGLVASEGAPVDVISDYHKILFEKEEKALRAEQIEKMPAAAPPQEDESPAPEANRWGSKEAEITGIEFLDERNEKCDVFKTGDFMKVRIHYEAKERIKKPVFGIAFYREDGIHINGPNTKTSNYDIEHIEGKGYIEHIINSIPFLPDTYLFTASIYDYSCINAYDHWERCFKFSVVESERIKERYGVFYIPSEWRHHGQ